jgi:hypothetical protein
MIDSVNFQSFIEAESLYFSKYGKGGVLVCAEGKKAYSLAANFNSKHELDSLLVRENFKKVRGIQVSDESIAVVLELSEANIVKRIMPKYEVTVEVYGAPS